MLPFSSSLITSLPLFFFTYFSGHFSCADSTRRHRPVLASNDEAVNTDQFLPATLSTLTSQCLKLFIITPEKIIVQI
jgi:hypothetical protein